MRKRRWFSVKPYDYLPCAAQEFKIKGRPAELREFGHFENGTESDPDRNTIKWGCYKRHFVTTPYSENQSIIKRYNLTEKEYEELTGALRGAFSVGTCELCV